jgi:translation initiation factor 2 beta subunit (eIF-2beta)/eIF-5
MEGIDAFVELLARNREIAEKLYPELDQKLRELVKKNTKPHEAALFLLKLPEHFNKWKTEIEEYYGITRTKAIEEKISIYNGVLFEYEYQNEVEQMAFESVRDELTEQLEYWKRELLPKPKDSNNQTESFEDLDDTSLDDLKNKLRYFHELGVYEFIQNQFKTKPLANGIALILKRMLGDSVKQDTIRKYVQASLKNDFDSDFHAEQNNERMSKVRKNLRQFGDRT